MADLHSIAHELYGLPLAEFIQTRDAWAATERDGGDDQLSKDVRALRKPSVTAWAVNMVARSQPDLLEELAELGVRLRQAQADSDGSRLRSLDQDRRRLMARVAAEVAATAERDGQSLSPSATAAVDETMKAALADPAAGRAVLDGMLVAGLSAPGFGAVDLSETVAIEPGATRTASPQKVPSRKAPISGKIAAARRAASAARRDASAAGQAAGAARAKLDRVTEQQADLEHQLADLAAQVEKVEGRLVAVNERVKASERAVDQTGRAEGDALQALEEAEARMADLEG